MRIVTDIPKSPRAARYSLERVRDLIGHLEMTRIALKDVGYDTDAIENLLTDARIKAERLRHVAEGRIESRRTIKHLPRPMDTKIPEYYLFLDECGTPHASVVDEKFPVFCLSGVIVSRQAYEAFDVTWKAWKTRHLSSPDALVHEPEVRTGSKWFWRPDPGERAALFEALDDVLSELDFRVIGCVVDLKTFKALHPDDRVDEYLPQSIHLMSIDFVLERFVHFLQHGGNDGKGLVVAESRGLKDDAIVHAEFIRLHLQGTQFISQSDFRRHLRPYIEFFRKKRNWSGLEIADLSARPLADVVLNPGSHPDRWEVFGSKLYDGGKGAPHTYGLKVYPLTEANDPFPHLPRKAKEDA